jgi:phosphatidylserine decarboxylase
MIIHREGYKTIALSGIIYLVLCLLNFTFLSFKYPVLAWIIFIVTTFLFLFLISFFRVPSRKMTMEESAVIAPADGKVVVIEETVDPEYFKDKRLQISIFMSPANVHVNRAPVSGDVIYSKHHNGKFLVAWDPKSSTDNERHSVVIRHGKTEILVKQIAGALAKRIVNYLRDGQKITQTAEMGFIKFGSRVDVLLPPGTKVDVKIGQNVQGGITVLAHLEQQL